MPVDAPPIIGESTLTDYPSARELYDFISVKMPFSEPGVLSSDDNWALTAFLVREHGILPDSIRLEAANASSVHMNQSSTPALDLPLMGLAVAALIVLIFLLLLWRSRFAHT